MLSKDLRKIRFAFVCVTFLLISAGCGSKEKEGNTSVAIDKNGRITNVIYEEFDQDYYDISELSKMADTEISAYNSERLSDKITLDSVELIGDSSTVKMVVSFNDCSDFSSFNKTALYYGTVQDAIDRGYRISDELVSPGGDKLGQDGLSDYYSRHIIITGDKSDFQTPYNIAYATKGVQITGKKEAVLSSSAEDEIQLLLSK